ncbi:MAG: heavy metal translocating P-type ATPase metal-binding domain-containing protein [Coraliomargaritaceae bacterium]
MKRSGCIHCGTPIRSGQGSEGFCCHGCEQVHRLIQEDGLSTFYSLQDHPGRPVDEAGEGIPDLTALRSVVAKAEEASAGATASVSVRVSGMTCLACVWLIEQLIDRFAGCRPVRVSLQERIVELSWEKGSFDLVKLARELARYGYVLSPLSPQGFQLSGWAWRAILCGVLAINGIWLEQVLGAGFLEDEVVGLFHILSLSIVVLSLFAGGGIFFGPSLLALRIGVLHIDLPTAVGLGLLLVSLLVDSCLVSQSTPQWGLLPSIICILLTGRWLHSWLWRKVRIQVFRQMTVSARSSVRWRKVYFWQCILFCSVGLVALIISAFSLGYRISLEGFVALLLAPALFPLATVARYCWPLLWMWGGFFLAWLGILLSWIFTWSALHASLWTVLSGLLWLTLLAAFHREEKVMSN